MLKPRVPKSDIILLSRELKKLIIDRLTELNISKFQLCEDLEIDYEKFKYYLNCSEAPKYASITQGELLNIASALGVAVRVTIVMLPKEKATAKKFDKERYEKNMVQKYKMTNLSRHGKKT